MDFDQASKLYNDYQQKYKASFTDEQKEIEKLMIEVRKAYLDPVLNEKKKKEEQEKLEKYRKENPFLQYVAKLDEDGKVSVSSLNSTAPPPAIQPVFMNAGPTKSPVKSLDKSEVDSQPKKEETKEETKKETKEENKDNLLIVQKKTTVRSHYMQPLVIKALKARCHVWLVGPAGSGKSAMAANAAAELNLPYASLSVCGQTTKTDLLGYLNAQGVYQTTCFRQAYEQGGLFCLDEVDNGNANVLAVINSALSNSVCTFPDKTVTRHPNFIVIACANTFGLGAQAGYVGRTQIDAATLDRFFFIEIPYDDGLEMHIIGNDDVASPVWNAQGTYVPSATEWIELVKYTRDRIFQLNAKAIISPRATVMGSFLIKEEVPLYYLQRGLLYKGLSSDLISKIRQ